MTGPLAYATVTFRNTDTGRANERVISVKDRSWRTDEDIASDAHWIVSSWRNVDRDSVSVVKVERADDLAASYAARREAEKAAAT